MNVLTKGLNFGHIDPNDIDLEIETVLKDAYPILIIIAFVFLAYLEFLLEVENPALLQLKQLADFLPFLLDEELPLLVLLIDHLHHLGVVVLVLLDLHLEQLVAVSLMQMQLIDDFVSVGLQLRSPPLVL